MRPPQPGDLAAFLTGQAGGSPVDQGDTDPLLADGILQVRGSAALAGCLAGHPQAAQRLGVEIMATLRAEATAQHSRHLATLARIGTREAAARQSLRESFSGPGTNSPPPAHTGTPQTGPVPQGSPLAAPAAALVAALAEGTRAQATIRAEFRRAIRARATENTRVWLARARTLAEREERIHDFFGDSPRLWDLEEGQWQGVDWGGFDRARDLMARYPELGDLARILGRSRGPIRIPHRRPALVPVTRARTEARGRSGLSGYHQGNDLELVLPTEVAHLGSPGLEERFYERYADKRLVLRDYVSRETVQADTGRRQVVYRTSEVTEEEGPVVVCMDTSGSMAGFGEEGAKALALALVLHCLPLGRKVYVVAFSSDIRCFDMGDPGASLAELGRFMALSAHGGTDLRPALAETLRLMEGSDYHHGDVVVVSDFRVPKILIKKGEMVDALRTRHRSRLHGITINDDGLVDDLNIFDTTWHFALPHGTRRGGISPGQFRNRPGV